MEEEDSWGLIMKVIEDYVGPDLPYSLDSREWKTYEVIEVMERYGKALKKRSEK